MTDSSTHEVSNEASNNNHSPDQDVLVELRNLLVGPEQTQLVKLHERLNDPKLYAEDLSRVLAEAIILKSLQQDKQLTQALLPTIEEAIQASVKKDLNILANAIFPVIGPAIRKAIAAALEVTLQSLNQVSEHSFSVQSFKWRLEALQTGKSFAEVVLLRTLVYRVEQVFLIHKKTGLVLQHVVANAVAAQDADLVSAMLTAIQDFVQDSFKVQKGEVLETLHFGELTISIEQGPQAVLASVIRGNPPKELKFVFQEAIEKLHIELSSEIEAFQGDSSPFEASKLYLEDCLQAGYKQKEAKKEKPKKEKPKKESPFLWVSIGAILLGLGLWLFLSTQAKQRWAAYVEQLNAQPGMVVLTAEKRHGKYFISGLRDPLAVDPMTIMQEAKLNPKTVVSKWEPYLSFDSSLITIRAKQLLLPPSTVSLKVDENGILHVDGTAPRQWIFETRKMVRFIPGITQFQEKNLLEKDLKKIEISKAQIEKTVLYFEEGTTKFKLGQTNKLETLVKELKELSEAAPFHNKDVHIQIIGHTNERGSQEKNMSLSQSRAYAVLSSLVTKGIKTTALTAVGVGTQEPLFNEFKQKDKELNRSVTFKVFLTDASNKTPKQ